MFRRNFFSRIGVYMAPLDDEGSAGGGAGGSDFNMDSAIADIADGLGFTSESEDGNDDATAGAGTGDGAVSGTANADAVGDDQAAKPAAPAPSNGDAPDPAQSAEPGAAVTPPRTWRPEAAAKWAALPAEVQQEITKREADMFSGIEAYKTDASTGKAFQNAIAPFAETLKRVGADPVQLTREFMQVHLTLAGGTPEQKQSLARQMLNNYGINLAPPQDDPNAPFVAPEVRALQQEINSLKSQLNGTSQQAREVYEARQAETRSKLSSEVDAFEKDPANVHFKEVAGMIPQILRSGLAKDLKSAYEQAVMANPVTREKEIARRTAEAAQKAATEAATKAEAARKAASANVKARARQASGTAPLGSIDDTLQETYRKITSRGQ